MTEPLGLTVGLTLAFALGMGARLVGLPPLVGFLAAGFALSGLGQGAGLDLGAFDLLEPVAHLGVLLLLFTVGLKLRLGQLVQGPVVGGALVHFALSVALLAPGLALLAGLDWNVAVLLAVALSFSSTVLAAKLLEGKRELGAFHGRTAIGILVVQDLLALGVLALGAGQVPSPWALGLLALPLLRPALHRAMDWAEDELVILLGMVLALVIGGAGFEALGLSGEIGALVMGLLMSGHPQAKALSQSLWSLKEVFLVGFFLKIGLRGLPDSADLIFAAVATVLLWAKGALFFGLLVLFGLRARSAFLAALSLTAYSEFGLIVAAALLPDHLVALALAVALSFVIAAPLNRAAGPLFDRFEGRLTRYQRRTIHPDEQPRSLGGADVLVLGMGRTGLAAYERLAEQAMTPLALDADPFKVQHHRAEGRRVEFADATDSALWRHLDLTGLRAVVLALDDVDAKVLAARWLRARGFQGPIVAHALHESYQAALIEAGVDSAWLTMTQAGFTLADRAVADLAR